MRFDLLDAQFGAAGVRLQAFAIRQLGRDLAQRLGAGFADTWMIDERFWKSYTPSGDEKRAVREVGSTWFGPQQ
jgi:hypothetical protein